MKRCRIVIFLILLCVGSTHADVPTFAGNHVSGSSTQGNTVNQYNLRLPNATMSGNCLVVGFQYSAGGGVTASVSDDKGDSFSAPVSHSDGNQIVNLSYALNVSAGAQKITITFSGGGASYVSALATEFYNIAPANALDGSSGNDGTGASVTAGAFTPANSGDLVYQYAVEDSSSNPINSWTQGAGPWQLLSADTQDASAAQYEVQTSAASITPSLGMSPSQNFTTVAIALKAGNSGSAPPAGIRVLRVQHNAIVDANSTSRLQFPCTGNLIVLAWIGAPDHDITGVSDGNGNHYVSPTAAFGFGLSGDSQIYYVANASTSSTMTGPTITTTNTDSSGSTAVMFDVSGAATSPYDTSVEASGNQTSNGNVTGATISPSTANGLVIATIGVDSESIDGVTPGNFLSSIVNPEAGENPVDENNGWALWYNPSAGSGTFLWSTLGGPVFNWSSIAVAFKAASGSGSSGSFSGTVSPSSATIDAGGSQMFNIQITSLNNFQGQISLSCPTAPVRISCVFATTPVSLNSNGTASSTLTISVAQTALFPSPSSRSWPTFSAPVEKFQAIAAFSLPLLLFVFCRARSRQNTRHGFASVAATAFLVALTLGFVSCGGGASGPGPGGGGGNPTTVQVSVQGVSGNLTENLGTVTITIP